MTARKIWTILRSEYWRRVRSKAFILTTLLAPIGIVLLALAPGALMYVSQGSATRVAVSRLPSSTTTISSAGYALSVSALSVILSPSMSSRCGTMAAILGRGTSASGSPPPIVPAARAISRMLR